ncbi:MAG: hypothetical protein EA350_08100 [Gemmatimonadales bacterium]|nr:MAG: hypothetical protein EA350_08100 [Gemmatimonadales bacterium]
MVEVLRARIRTPWPALHLLTGPAGVGKTVVLRQALAGHPAALHWDVPPLEEDGALEDLDRLLSAALGELPSVRARPDLLPLPGAGLRWRERLEGALMALGARGEAERGPEGGAHGGAGVLVLDGMGELAGARRHLPDEVLELWGEIRDRGLPVHLVTTWRTPPPAEWRREGEPLELSAHPFRAAARAHGARTAEEGFQRWAIFGHHPAHLPRTPPRGSHAGRGDRVGPDGAALRDAVVERILTPGGDLHDAPLHRLAAQVQVPRRYLEILVALARGASGWGGMATRVAGGAGNRLAPYLRRLEADGWIRVLHPLDGRAGGRQRRYALADPFSAFWFGHVLPIRSLLHREDPGRVWDRHLAPALPGYLALRLPELARLWIEGHATERLPAAAREVGALWTGDVELDVAARLANGQVCYGICQGPTGEGDRDPQPGPGGTVAEDVALFIELERKMRDVRWGIGREARAPLVFLARRPSDELRRRVARTSLGRILTLDDLMGELRP